MPLPTVESQIERNPVFGHEPIGPSKRNPLSPLPLEAELNLRRWALERALDAGKPDGPPDRIDGLILNRAQRFYDFVVNPIKPADKA